MTQSSSDYEPLQCHLYFRGIRLDEPLRAIDLYLLVLLDIRNGISATFPCFECIAIYRLQTIFCQLFDGLVRKRAIEADRNGGVGSNGERECTVSSCECMEGDKLTALISVSQWRTLRQLSL